MTRDPKANKVLLASANLRRIQKWMSKLKCVNQSMTQVIAEADALIAQVEAELPPLSRWQKLKRFLGLP